MWLALVLVSGLDLAAILKSIENPATRESARRELITLARSGDAAAQWQAVVLSRKGQLPSLPVKQAGIWFGKAIEAALPEACLAAARSEIETNREPEAKLRCAAEGSLAEAEYLLGRLILNRIAAEDEADRFEGLAWVALAAKSGYGPATRRWEIIATELTLEDLERVEQKTKKLKPQR